MSEKIRFLHRDIKISLYKQPKTDHWFGSFSFEKKRHRFTCKSSDIQTSKNHCYDVVDKLLKGGEEIEQSIAPINEHFLTFDEVFKKFLQYKTSSNSIQKTTQKNYMQWGKHLIQFCGNWTEKDFIKYGIELYGEYLTFRRTRGREEYQYFVRDGIRYRGRKLSAVLSGTTLNCELVLFHNILSFWKYDLSMLKAWDIPKVSYHKQPEINDIVCPTKEEYIKMKQHFRSIYREDIEIWMRLASNTGMRPSEIEKLKVSDINFEDRILYIRDRKTKKKKTGKELNTLIPITDRLEPILQRLLIITEENRKEAGSDLIFVNPSTGKAFSYRQAWSTMIKDLELDERYKMKTMRKYYISKMVKESSMPLSVLANLIGHSSIDTLQKHYLHLRVDDLRDTLEWMYYNKEIKKEERQDRNNQIDGLMSSLDDI